MSYTDDSDALGLADAVVKGNKFSNWWISVKATIPENTAKDYKNIDQHGEDTYDAWERQTIQMKLQTYLCYKVMIWKRTRQECRKCNLLKWQGCM